MFETTRYAYYVARLLLYERAIIKVHELFDLSSFLQDLVNKAIKAGERALELSSIVNGLPLDGVIDMRLDYLRYNYSRYLAKS